MVIKIERIHKNSHLLLHCKCKQYYEKVLPQILIFRVTFIGSFLVLWMGESPKTNYVKQNIEKTLNYIHTKKK